MRSLLLWSFAALVLFIAVSNAIPVPIPKDAELGPAHSHTALRAKTRRSYLSSREPTDPDVYSLLNSDDEASSAEEKTPSLNEDDDPFTDEKYRAANQDPSYGTGVPAPPAAKGSSKWSSFRKKVTKGAKNLGKNMLTAMAAGGRGGSLGMGPLIPDMNAEHR